MLRARLLYNNIAKVTERVMIRPKGKSKTATPKSGPNVWGLEGFYHPGAQQAQTPNTRTPESEEYAEVWYGAHIPTLCRLLEEGYFD